MITFFIYSFILSFVITFFIYSLFKFQEEETSVNNDHSNPGSIIQMSGGTLVPSLLDSIELRGGKVRPSIQAHPNWELMRVNTK